MTAPKALALRAVKSLAVAADRLHPPGRGVVVLLYHRVEGGSGLDVDMPVELFDDQMAELADGGRVVSLDQGLAALSAEPPVQDPVVITFDDGTADVVEHALPVLVRHRVPATVYLATDFVDRQVDFPDDGRPLSWDAVREAVSTGLVTIGSHTHHHLLLDRLTPAEVDAELTRSVELIGQHTGTDAAPLRLSEGRGRRVRAVSPTARSAVTSTPRPSPTSG